MLDVTVVCAHLVLMLGVGLAVSRGVRARTLSEFALGGRDHSNLVLASTFFAAAMGGSATLGNAERAFRVGITYPFVCAVGFVVSDLLAAWFIAPRMQRFAGCLSCGDIMGRLYGKVGQVSTGLATVALCLTGTAAQLVALGYIGELLGVSHRWGAFLGIATVVLYSTWGGVRSVAVTDVWQLVTMLVAGVLLCGFGLARVGGVSLLLSRIPLEHATFFPTRGSLWEHVGLLVIFSFPFLSPPKVHRLLLARDGNQAATCLRVSAALKGVLTVMTGCTGLVALALAPRSEPNAAMPFVVQHVLPVGLRGLAVAGLVSAMMSTCDSLLHTSGIALVHDVVGPLRRLMAPVSRELLFARIATVGLAVLSVALTGSDTNIIDLILRNFDIWLPTLFVPLLLGLLGMRGSQRAFLSGAIAGALCWFAWSWTFVSLVPLRPAIPAALCNALVFGSVYWVDRKAGKHA